MLDQDRTRITYRYERVRALAAGVLEAAAVVFLLLIAVREFNPGPLSKALIAGGGSFGLLLAPWLVSHARAVGWESTQAASRLSALSAVCYLVIAVIPLLPVFVLGSVVAQMASSSIVPFLTQIFHENYPQDQRGRLYARTVVIRIAAAALFSYGAGWMLSSGSGRYQWLLLIFSLAAALTSYCLSRCPSKSLAATEGTHPFRALRYAREDRVFRQTLIAWMFLGFAMLMISPMRVEYLANPKYGVLWRGETLTAGLVALLTGVIPNIARLFLNPLWGWLFDRMNFFILRLSLNAGFMAGIISFFVTGSSTGLVIGAILWGISSAGADVAWSLWVTKFAPAERVADYMAVHTFFTGVRGVVAPIVAFYLVSGIQPAVLGCICVGLILIGSGFLIPEIKFGRGARRGTALVEEVSE